MDPSWTVGVERALRVASTLLARFQVIAEGKPASSEDLELRIGESQQIYPELWRSLDDAERGLAAHGRDVSAYVELRRAELVALGTDADVERPDYTALAVDVYRDRSFKAASFNVGSARRAAAACRALMAALPEVEWSAIAAAGDEQIAEAGSLNTRRWLGIVTWGLAAAAVVGIGVAIYRLATREEALDREARVRAASDPFVQSAAQLDQVASHAREARIADLTMIHDTTCDRRVIPELARLLRASNQAHRADALEHEPCAPVRPSCEPVKEILATRLSHQLKLYRDHGWRMQCEGLLVPGATGLMPALAILITGGGHDKIFHALRGITSTDGHRDLVAFAPPAQPGRIVGIADLDDEPGDEIVFAGAELVVTRIVDGRFDDVVGPALVGVCSANASVEGDFRHGRSGAGRYVVLTVDDQAPSKGCPKPGRHYYGLVKGAVAETE